MGLIGTQDAWTEAMRRGDFSAAWRISDTVLLRRIASRERCHDWPRHLQFIWDGTELAGKRVLVRCYHGLGDTIQFARFLAPLRELAREVTLWVQPSLLPLLRSVRGIDRIMPLHDGKPNVDYDVDIELMELGHALRIEPQGLGEAVPYIYVYEKQMADGGLATGRTLSDRGGKSDRPLCVGLVWRGGDWDERRSVPDELIARLIEESPQVQWYSLQYPASKGPASKGDRGLRIVDLSSRDIAVMAHRMQMLDLIISVDTMAAHLAGALGLPVWTLLHADCDWRWMAGRTDSPWYPSMRLFRQRTEDDWRAVIDEVVATLLLYNSALNRERGIRSAGYTASSR